MQLDYVALAIICSFAVLSIIMFIIFRKQSKKSEHPEATVSNASNPTLLQHAPPDSQSAYSVSMLSLIKTGSPDPNNHGTAEEEKLAEEERKFKRRLFFEDTADDSGVAGKCGSQAV